MGYEILFRFHEKLDGGGYDTINVKEMTRKVGEPFDDVPLEKVVSVIMAQYARRDILVVDVKPIEYSKKEISFKETKEGIILKNKKYNFDQQTAVITCQEIAPQPAQIARHPHEEISAAQRHPHEMIRRPAGAQVKEHPHNRVSTYSNAPRAKQKRMIFAPSNMDLVKQHKVFGLTVEKEYTILSERMNESGVGQTLVVMDDNGMQQEVSDEFFIPTTMELFADRQLGFTKPPPSREHGGNLKWEGVINDDVPDVRSRR